MELYIFIRIGINTIRSYLAVRKVLSACNRFAAEARCEENAIMKAVAISKPNGAHTNNCETEDRFETRASINRVPPKAMTHTGRCRKKPFHKSLVAIGPRRPQA